MLTSPLLAHVPHGFTTRADGDDWPFFDGRPVVRLNQVHSPDAVVVRASDLPGGRIRADAMVTADRTVALAIVTADCAPVLFADPAAGVVGAAHAGWRGALGSVIVNTITAMEELGAEAERVRAVIGPAIAQQSYEVDAALHDRFVAEAPGAARFFTAGAPEKWQFDLPGFVADRLAAAGVGGIADLALDTYADPDRFFSYRRATHQGAERREGRQTSLVALP
jgi:YfiH family protein